MRKGNEGSGSARNRQRECGCYRNNNADAAFAKVMTTEAARRARAALYRDELAHAVRIHVARIA
ncbi:hypothetical protein CA831_31830, partial [Burkholderia multivorans]